MSSIVSNVSHARSERFEPEPALDPSEQRKLRGHLEQIDYAAFAANRAIVAKSMGRVELSAFEHLAVAAAHARTRWVMAVLRYSTFSILFVQRTQAMVAGGIYSIEWLSSKRR